MNSKDDVRAIAREIGLEVADKKDSMDFYSGDKTELIDTDMKNMSMVGDIVDKSGMVIGKHAGYWKYTIGQRHGFKINATRPHYVIKIIPAENKIVVGPRESACRTTFQISSLNQYQVQLSDHMRRLRFKIRSNGSFQTGICRRDPFVGDYIVLDQPAFGVTPGQLAVGYDHMNRVVCSGYIC